MPTEFELIVARNLWNIGQWIGMNSERSSPIYKSDMSALAGWISANQHLVEKSKQEDSAQ